MLLPVTALLQREPFTQFVSLEYLTVKHYYWKWNGKERKY